MNLHLARLDRMAPGSDDNVLRCYRHPDRETGVSCSECGRGICPDCMTFSPVGIRCPDHAGVKRGPAKKVVRNLAAQLGGPVRAPSRRR